MKLKDFLQESYSVRQESKKIADEIARNLGGNWRGTVASVTDDEVIIQVARSSEIFKIVMTLGNKVADIYQWIGSTRGKSAIKVPATPKSLANKIKEMKGFK
jgi:hypothetical protein